MFDVEVTKNINMASPLKQLVKSYKNLFKKLNSSSAPRPIYHRLSYSQEGEDMVLSRIFEEKDKGFYVDVGAHHPQRFSNTYYFYLLGWHGINIDAMPGSMNLFYEIRPQDTNLELAISDREQLLVYYSFNDSALNSFCKNKAEEYQESCNYQLIEEREIQTYSLTKILDQYLPENQTIDFLNIDVEGLDYQVLTSNNWNKYRPTILLIEDLQSTSLNQANESIIANFMSEQNYSLYCKTMNTLFFKKN